MRAFFRAFILFCVTIPGIALADIDLNLGEPEEEEITDTDKEKPDALNYNSNAGDATASRYSQAYIALLQESMRCFHARDFVGALRFVDQAETIMAPSPYSINIRGAVATEQFRFDDAWRYLMEAIKMNPNFYEAWFNICEISFLQKKYEDARKGFLKLQANAPKDEVLIYRIFLTYLLEKNDEQALIWKQKIPFPSETPAYHYANAAWEFAHGNTEKGLDWVADGEWVWPESKRANFVDVLIHLGWVKPAAQPEVLTAPKD